ncbi:MAG TPA: A/G-specific adenine glycosylase [Candidatus Limnocylindrales bacterium]|nr:A/G-specific adenine glycosylase [Candidatus Limnocylindrales bacterium]
MSPARRRSIAPAIVGPSPSPGVDGAVRHAVLAWYDATGRELAFRTTVDPYAVLVSELMAQQTQAARAADAWTAWMRRFPSVEALAVAPVAEVVRAWAGLGYNRRAVLLHRAARTIVDEHGGRVPASVDELQALPGVGPYTARAVAAIAFGEPVGAVDVNVRRVLGRIVAGGPEALSAAEMQALADASVPQDRTGAWTHALMDVGQRVCRPRRPRCADCPAISWCAHAAGVRPSPAPVRANGASARRPEPRFESTNRWLRGRILERARTTDVWTRFDQPIGGHGSGAVRSAVLGLARDGLVEARDTPAGPEARLPR